MLTPLEIRKKEFRRCFRGYDEQEVDSFLDRVTATVEELIKENARLQELVERSEQNIARYQEIEDALKQTMVFAQKNAQELKSNVEKEAEVILQEARAQAAQITRDATREAEQTLLEAERRAEDVLHKAHQQAEHSLNEAHRRVDQLLREYQEIEKQVKVFRAKFRSFLEAQLSLLDDEEYGIGRELRGTRAVPGRYEEEEKTESETKTGDRNDEENEAESQARLA